MNINKTRELKDCIRKRTENIRNGKIEDSEEK